MNINTFVIKPHITAYLMFVLIGMALVFCFYQIFYSITSEYVIYFLAWLWAIFLALYINFSRLEALLNKPNKQSDLFIWLIIIGFALVFRGMAFTAEPYLADDYERYLFDGRIQLSGFNPYAVIPINLPDLGGVNIPKPEVKTIYPPLAELLFSVSVWFGDSLLSWKLFSLIPDLLGAVFFVGILKALKQSSLLAIFWLWNPLLLKEISHSGHLDIWTLFVLVLFLYFALYKRLRLAAFFLALAVLIKLIPLIILPAWIKQIETKKQRAQVILIGALTLFLGFIIYFPEHPFLNIAYFYQHIQGYGSFYQMLSLVIPEEHAKTLLMSFAGALYLYLIFIKKRYHTRPVLDLSELFLLGFVFSSMGFPWYLLLCLPWILLKRDWVLMAFIAFTHLNFYSYQLNEPTLILPLTLSLLLFYWLFTKTKENSYGEID